MTLRASAWHVSRVLSLGPLSDAFRRRLPEWRALTRGPVFKLYVTRVRAASIAMVSHIVFMTLILEPALAYLMPPPAKKTGLAAIFGGPQAPPPHEEVLKWLDPVLWVLGWAAFCIWLDRSVKPALERARQRSRDLEAEGVRKLAKGEVLAGLTLLEQAEAVSPDPQERERIQGTLLQVRSTQVAPGAIATAMSPSSAATAAAQADPQATAIAPPAAEKPRPTMAGGRLTLDESLGAGAMGRVFAATDQLLGRRVAVKELAEGIAANEEYRERFLREARVLARLSHPNIVQVFDLLAEGSRHYLCMELVEGSSLEAELTRRGVYPVRDAAALGRQIAEALAYAHGREVVHRDLKPANVLVTHGGTVKVVDFGVARLADQRMTRTGVLMGTPVYMAPEQIQGGEIDARADLYALGVLLFELATGKAPFDGNIAAVFAKHLTETPPRLQLDPRDPAAQRYADLVAALRAKDPAVRPASAADVAAELAQIGAAAAA